MTTHSTNDRLQQLTEIVVATAEVLGQEITATGAAMMARDLSDYDDGLIADALKACRRELTGKLTLAAIINRIERGDGHPEPNEAWAIALNSTDEAATVIMTEQIGKAMAAARPVLELGDKVGARMAFLEAYRREVDIARQRREVAGWQVSLGWDSDSRQHVLDDAVQRGLINHKQAPQLPAPVEVPSTETQRHNIARLKQVIADTQCDQSDARRLRKANERRDFEAHKKAEVSRLQDWADQEGVS